MSKIVLADIETRWGGFSVEKITKATDEQLRELETRLSDEVDSTMYANIEEYRYLNVAWHSKITTGLKDKTAIVKILNEIFCPLQVIK